MILEELRIDPKEARFQQAVDFMLSKIRSEIEGRLIQVIVVILVFGEIF